MGLRTLPESRKEELSDTNTQYRLPPLLVNFLFTGNFFSYSRLVYLSIPGISIEREDGVRMFILLYRADIESCGTE
jgi:hypothetical protein